MHRIATVTPSPAHSSPKRRRSSKHRLAGYLTAGVCGSVLGTSSSDAAIVAFDLSGFSGANGGAPAQFYVYAYITGTIGEDNRAFGFAALNTVQTQNNSIYYTTTGLMSLADGGFLVSTGLANAYPLAAGAAINSSGASSATWDGGVSFYKYNQSTTASDTTTSFGLSTPTYLGVRFNTLASNLNNDYYYGYLEVSWDAASLEFQLVSGAYNDVLNEAITAGAAVTPVPEPSSGPLAMGAVAALVMGGSAARRWKQERRQQAAADTPQPSA